MLIRFYATGPIKAAKSPSYIDLSMVFANRDQGSIGSCTAHAGVDSGIL